MGSLPTHSKPSKLIPMGKLTATICLTIAVLLGSVGCQTISPSSYLKNEVRRSDLPLCPSDQNQLYKNCFGTYVWNDGKKYIGEHNKEGEHHGQGTKTYPNGYRQLSLSEQVAVSKYVGQWRDGKWHGQGRLTYANGRVREGIWKNDKFQDAQKISPTVTARKSSPPSTTKSVSSYNFNRKYLCVGASRGHKFSISEVRRLNIDCRTNTVTKRDGKSSSSTKSPPSKSAAKKPLNRFGSAFRGYSNNDVCDGVYEARPHLIKEAKQRGLTCPKYPWNNSPTVTARKFSPTYTSAAKKPPLGSEVRGFDLPPCRGSYNQSTWSDCFGEFHYAADGDYYSGGYKNGKKHGQGTYLYADYKRENAGAIIHH